MTDFYELGSSLFGRKRAEINSVLSDGTTHTYVGTATTDSEDGSVMVELSEDVTNPEPVEGADPDASLTEYFSHTPADYTYFYNVPNVRSIFAVGTQLSEGWMRIDGTAAEGNGFSARLTTGAVSSFAEDGETYTLMVEVANLVAAPQGTCLRATNSGNILIGDGSEQPQFSEGVFYYTYTAQASGQGGIGFDVYLGSERLACDIRMSLYEGVYRGAYKPTDATIMFYEDADTSVELPTTANVKAGDDVLVTVYGGTPLRSPVVTGVVGSGDRLAADAEAAREIAEATGQHFWDDDNGAHVTELARPDWETQQTGPNSLWNSLGMLFRDGLDNLLAIVAGSSHTDTFTIVSEQTRYPLEGDPTEVTSATIGGEPYTNGELVSDINGSFYRIDYFDSDTYAGQTLEVAYRSSSSLELYDGAGNTSDDIVATFSAHVIELGRSAKDALIKLLDGVVYFRATNYGTEQDPQYVGNIVSGHGLELVSKGSDDSGRGNISVRGSKNSLDQAYSSITLDVASSTDNATILLEASNGTLLQLAAASAGRLYTGNYTIPEVISALNKSVPQGTIYKGTGSNNIPTVNTDVLGGSVTIPAGTYILYSYFTFQPSTGTGTRRTTTGIYVNGSYYSYSAVVQGDSVTTVRTPHIDFLVLGSQSTVQVYGACTKTVANNGPNFLQLIRIA